jgi:aminopeptidase-like protein
MSQPSPPLQIYKLGESDVTAASASMLALMSDLYPYCRSITGPGLRATLNRIGEAIPLSMTEVPTGAKVFDWIIPREWSIEEAYLEHESGRRVLDFRDSNLHVVSYSAPVDAWLSLDELRPRLHSLPQHPDWIPFRSSYYTEDWGFCLSDKVRSTLPPGKYHAVIRSRLYEGSLTFGEYRHPGTTDEEVIFFAHVCHPSLCNDNLSGIAVATEVARYLHGRETRYTYRFVFAPATIGSLAWLAANASDLGRVRHGLVLAMIGDARPLRYHRTLTGNAAIDRAAIVTLKAHQPNAELLDFSPWGFDERQFNSPGFRLPVGRLTRALAGEYPEEHTSADSMDLMTAESLGEAWRTCLRIVEVLESDARYKNLSPNGEPQLGRRGLYRKSGGYYSGVADRQLALLWLLNQSDGNTSLLDIAERSKLEFGLIARCALELQEAGLLAPVDG